MEAEGLVRPLCGRISRACCVESAVGEEASMRVQVVRWARHTRMLKRQGIRVSEVSAAGLGVLNTLFDEQRKICKGRKKRKKSAPARRAAVDVGWLSRAEPMMPCHSMHHVDGRVERGG